MGVESGRGPTLLVLFQCCSATIKIGLWSQKIGKRARIRLRRTCVDGRWVEGASGKQRRGFREGWWAASQDKVLPERSSALARMGRGSKVWWREVENVAVEMGVSGVGLEVEEAGGERRRAATEDGGEAVRGGIRGMVTRRDRAWRYKTHSSCPPFTPIPSKI